MLIVGGHGLGSRLNNIGKQAKGQDLSLSAP